MAIAKPSTALSDRQIHLIAKALSDPRRYQILQKIFNQKCPTTCSDILQCGQITAATLSHHMKELETAGLVCSEKQGKFVNYTAQPQILRAYLNRLKSDLS